MAASSLQAGCLAPGEATAGSGASASGVCDCHIHINDPAYAYAPGADLHPPPATVAAYRPLRQALGITRVVVVQPSSYGLDNRCTLDAVQRFEAEGVAARAVVVIDADIAEADLVALHQAGARGVRFNLLRPTPVSGDALARVARRIAAWGWHLQLHAGADTIAAMAPALLDLPVPLVIDHMARLPARQWDAHPAMAALARLLARGRTWVKLSGLELDGAADAPAYSPQAALARRLLDMAADRMVWGTNWPHPATACRGEPMPDDAALLDWMATVAPDDALRRRVLWDNPGQLYGFEQHIAEPAATAATPISS
ncbi:MULTISPECIES: amidohydrolase family protein [unclassified Achromobacter]|uniref:amidohydrolase family protein n=1 Tax=unclassified Achromobacter TaxID=2626865 RepID=UPI00130366CC|nr:MULTISPECIES: amidohydrolase family protein [unclassified Achromobacter]